MEEKLSERLLSHELGWDNETAQREISKIKYLAAVKYDSYRNFEPGRRFIESLILWLRNFNSIDEKEAAYEFAMSRIVFISESQMDHLVDLLYPQRVFPVLCNQVVEKDGIEQYQIRKIRNSVTFQVFKRKTLFLGLSDGARIDAFRRKNSINNEQISVSYEPSKEKWQRMHQELEKWLNDHGIESESFFENIFLIDDFSGSGNSIFRIEEGVYNGKLAKFMEDSLKNEEIRSKYFTSGGPRIFVVSYLATRQALNSLRDLIRRYLIEQKDGLLSSCMFLEPLQVFEEDIKISQSRVANDLVFNSILNNYYDERLEDENTRKGGVDVKHGYAGCDLPLILCHNCPNNSVYLLWGQTEKTNTQKGLKALFPRICRHLEGR